MSAFTAEELGKHASSLRALARDLLRDEALAEDAVQDACVAALVRPPVGPVAAAAWLRKVVRNCAIDLGRSERRRQRRERLVARSEASEEVDAAERLELQHEIIAAVRSLDAPYRTAIWMRYYEHRSPSAIAAALGEPVKTVKTRLWRALQLLRQKLDHRYGDRRAWLGALVPLAKLSGRTSGLGAAVAAGALWMQAKPLVIATILGLALIAGGVAIWSGGVAPEVPLRPLAEQKAQVEQPGNADPGRIRRSADGTGSTPESAASAPSGYGSLVVHVRWHDGTPAAGIAIYGDVVGEPQLDRNEICVVSDRDGLTRAPRVHAGKVRLSSERGGRMDTEVSAAAQREVEFDLPRGIDVTGVVRDERQLPVAGADVVLVSPRAGWLGGRTVAVTDDVGAFAVRAVDPTWSFGARKPGYAPSDLVDLDDVPRPADGTSVQLELRLTMPGACVAGTVVDESGVGVAEAVVVVGYGRGATHVPGQFVRWHEQWSPVVTRTAADGSFRCEGIEPGMQQIVAWAEGSTRVEDRVQCTASAVASIRP